MNLRQEKGSVTLFVLIAMIFFCLMLLFYYINISNKTIEQRNNLEKIQEEYSNQPGKNIDEIYEENIRILGYENNQ